VADVTDSDSPADWLDRPLADIGWSVRTAKMFRREGLATFRDLVGRSQDRLMACRNFGRLSLNEVVYKLHVRGLRLAASDVPAGPANTRVDRQPGTQLDRPLSECRWPSRATNLFRRRRLVTFRDLVLSTARDLLSHPNFGATTLSEVEQVLHGRGLRLGMFVPGETLGGFTQDMGTVRTDFGVARYIRVQRHDGKPMLWREVYDTLRAVYPDGWAVEFYPPPDRLVDEANISHLYLLDGVVPAGVDICGR
jgi:hypothetical protein